MGLERIGDLYPTHPGWNASEKGICLHPEHNPPTLYLYPPGRYRYTCPGCGHVTEFDVYPEGSYI